MTCHPITASALALGLALAAAPITRADHDEASGEAPRVTDCDADADEDGGVITKERGRPAGAGRRLRRVCPAGGQIGPLPARGADRD